MIEFVGMIGAAGAACMWIPQVIRTLRYRHDRVALSGISVFTYLLAVGFNGLLLTYGLLQRAVPVVLAGSVNLVCSLVIAVVLVNARWAR